MLLTCESCSTEHDLEPPEWVESSGRAFRFRCSECGHSQMVTSPEDVPQPESTESATIYLKQDGKVYLVQGWETLKQWIAESRIGPEDLISEGGVRWEHVSSREEVADLFPDASSPSADVLPFGADVVEPTGDPVSSEVFGGVPTGLPPLPVLEHATAAVAAEATEAPEPESDVADATLDDSQDEVDRFAHMAEEPSEVEPEEPESLGEPGLTEELVMETSGDSIVFESADSVGADEAEDVESEAVVESSLDDDELFREFDKAGTAEPAPYAGDDWSQQEAARPAWPWVVAALVTLVALLFLGWKFLPQGAPDGPDEPDLSTALTLPVPDASVMPAMDVGADSDVDSETVVAVAPETPPEDVDADTAAAVAEPAPEPEPVAPTPEPVPVPDVRPEPAPVAAAPVPPRVEPRQPTVQSRIDAGWSAADGGNLSGAASEFQAALRLRPGSADANLGYGYVLAEQGQTGQARTYLCAARSGSGSTAAEARGILSRLELTCD